MRRCVALATTLALAGCSLAPRYERPAAPVANQFAAAGGSLAAVDQGWRAMFDDPRLQALIALALQNNRDLRIAALQVELTRAQYRIERAELFPQLGAAADATLANVTNASRYRVGITAAYELDLFGRVRSLKDAALEEYFASAAGYRAAHLALVGEVVAQYLRERGYAEGRVVAEQTRVAARELVELTMRMFEAGQRSSSTCVPPKRRCRPHVPTSRGSRGCNSKRRTRWCCWSASRCPRTCRRHSRLPHRR
jgi:multidrug efflux system outer membrane protein